MDSTTTQLSKKAKPYGKPPYIILSNPKYPHNVGAAMRACSCYGLQQLWYTGNRISDTLGDGRRLPREERMKGYAEVELIQFDYPFDQIPKGITPVAIEVRENSESLFEFEHPEKAVYVFGPEDGSIPKTFLHYCHRFVAIPSRHCLNLSAAVYTVLYDRAIKMWLAGHPIPTHISESLAEDRGFQADFGKYERS